MDSDRDDVLSLDERETSGEFSGFSPLNSPVHTSSKKKGKAPASKNKTNKKKGSKNSSVNKETQNVSVAEVNQARKQKDQGPLLDITKLTVNDISKLREALGIHNIPQNTQYAEEDNIRSVYGDSLENMPPLHVQFDTADLSDGEIPPTPDTSNNQSTGNRQIASEMSDALFQPDGDAEEWELPRLKAPEKGDPVSERLAEKVNMACVSACEIDKITSKYKVPQNCDKACSPSVNHEIWMAFNSRAQTHDKTIQDIQNLVATGMTPIIKLAEVIKPQIRNNPEAKTLLSDALTLLGQVQFNLSIRRRYYIRPNLRKKYHGLCNISTKITDQLFGDDISKEIKKCESNSGLAKDQYYGNYANRRPYRGRGTFNPRFSRRGYAGGQGYGFQQPGYGSNYYGYGYGGNQSYQRFQPYPQRGQYRQPMRGRGAKKAAATATAPNDQN